MQIVVKKNFSRSSPAISRQFRLFIGVAHCVVVMSVALVLVEMIAVDVFATPPPTQAAPGANHGGDNDASLKAAISRFGSGIRECLDKQDVSGAKKAADELNAIVSSSAHADDWRAKHARDLIAEVNALVKLPNSARFVYFQTVQSLEDAEKCFDNGDYFDAIRTLTIDSASCLL